MRVADHDIADDFVVFSENVSSILQVLTFFAFGGLIVATGYHADIPLLVAFIAFALLIARPIAISLSFVRVGLPRPHRAFIAWFGPEGGGGNPVRRAGAQLGRRPVRTRSSRRRPS